MSKIKVLDDLTIQKIAAGEVIERPGSIVKELVENSIDAKAENIVIEIKYGGKSYIRVTDDGEGMTKEDLELAFKRHSTSKLSSIEDLYNIFSLGFRGEALSSIVSVSKIEVLSKTQDDLAGIRAIIEDGKIISITPVGCPKGTTIIVKDLFYNIPVRKKFLKSDMSEGNFISNIINNLALGHFDKSFKFIKDNKVILNTGKNNKALDNIYKVLGKDISKNLLPLKHKDNNFEIKGFISNNTLYRGNRAHQYLYVNNRYVVNPGIAKVIENRYKSIIPLNRFPIFVLYIYINPNQIDVNIHPTKEEIKFIQKDLIFGTISNIIYEHLNPAISVPKMKFEDKIEDKKDILPKLFAETPINKSKGSSGQEFEDIIVYDFTKEEFPDKKKYEDSAIVFEDIEDINIDNSLIKEPFNEQIAYIDINENKKEELETEEIVEEQKIDDTLLDIEILGRAFNTYIIAESKNDKNLFFIDQHAAHERIMYEKYKRDYAEEKIYTQQLLSPEIIELNHTEKNNLMENIQLFKDIGFDLDEFGENSIAIRGIPMVFGAPSTKDLFLNILDEIKNEVKTSYDIRIDKIMKLACTSAIKSGDKLDDREIYKLVEDLISCENPYTCPHGRPTMIEMSKKSIEKEFLRIN